MNTINLNINFRNKQNFICLLFTIFLFLFKGYSQKDCNSPNKGLMPIPDLGSQYYRGFQGGLYAGGGNLPTGVHRSDLLSQSNAIAPLDSNGIAKAGGKIVMIGVGASNPRTEFNAFVSQARSQLNINPSLAFVNTCIGGQGVQKMNDPNDNYWKQAIKTLDSLKLNPLQVQIAWIETENTAAADTVFPRAAETLESELRTLLATLYIKFPNLKICYFSPRAYAGFAIPAQGGVGKGLLYPRDYYNGWAIKWLIQKTIDRTPGYLFEGTSKEIPYCTFGSYHWTNGSATRMDGFNMDCDIDIGSDGLHLTAQGEQKLGGHMLQFFMNDDLAKRWFLQTTTSINSTIRTNLLSTIYPNPIQDDVIKIQLLNPELTTISLRLYDQSGQLAMAFNRVVDGTEIKLDVSNLASGFYTLVLTSGNANIGYHKLIK
jgi:hypothetical protein